MFTFFNFGKSNLQSNTSTIIRMIRILLFSLIALSLNMQIAAQSNGSEASKNDSILRYIKKIYGLDQDLFNGVQYYKQYLQYMGDPYFPKDIFYTGSVSLKGKKHRDLQLKYDSYSQFLILAYTDFKNIYNQLMINSIHVDSFQLGKQNFQKLSLLGENPKFYQILNSGPLTCFIHWKKDITSTSYNFRYTHEFTEPIGKYYIKYRGVIQAFNNKESLASIFPESLKKDLKKYLRQQGFNFRQTGSADIQNMLDYIVNRLEILPEN